MAYQSLRRTVSTNPFDDDRGSFLLRDIRPNAERDKLA